jgi:hypothetical protein
MSRSIPGTPWTHLVCLALCLLSAAAASAQSAAFPDTTAASSPASAAPEPAAPQSAAVTTAPAASAISAGGFRRIRLGMSLEEVKTELRREVLFDYRGDRDVSLLPEGDQILIEVSGRSFVERGYFQFYDGRLLVMIVRLSRELVSYYEVYSRLTSHYGGAASLDPNAALWSLPGVRLSLEKPVVLKYVDSVSFDALKAKSSAGRDYEAETRAQFLDGL